MTRAQYITSIGQLAVDTTAGTRLFPSVLITQAIVESRNGNSILAAKYNNHFGIKADASWKGKKVNMKTREVFSGTDVVIGDYFRVYDTPKQGFIDRTNFLTKNKRYTTAGVFIAKTPEEQIEALKRAGYATDPNYIQILKDVLRQNNLAFYDTFVETIKKKV